MSNPDRSIRSSVLVECRSRCLAWMAASVVVPFVAVGCGASPMTLSVANLSQTATATTEVSPSTTSSGTVQESNVDSVDQTSVPELKKDTSIASVSESVTETNAYPVKVDSQQLIGCWRDSFYGQRTLTINEDGKATMLCELDFAARLLYGKQVEFDLSWTLADTKLVFAITSGRPMETARSAMQKWGETLEYAVQEATPDQLRVLCNDGTTVYTFRRLVANTESSNEDK